MKKERERDRETDKNRIRSVLVCCIPSVSPPVVGAGWAAGQPREPLCRVNCDTQIDRSLCNILYFCAVISRFRKSEI